jgi:hypothetical protein
MFRPAHAIAIAAILAACSDASRPVSPDLNVASARNETGGRLAEVRLFDACDPKTFAVIPGGCQRNGGITLTQFNNILNQTHSVPAWHMSPPDLYIREGDSFVAENYGGENHTFTEVEEFGGGVVPALNIASGNPVMAPECANLDILEPGEETAPDTPDEVGDEDYQCCIHPWMRMTVHVREK